VWERGEEILITKREPVAVLSPYRPPLMTPEREKAVVQHAIDVMGQGLSWGATLRRFRREQMHKR
jgi:antitoxin (DNA-binding transcriptional repressor) of toxin-antitoxin stability system